MSRKPHLHRAEEFDLSVDEHGDTWFIDLHRLSAFGRRHGGERLALALICFIQALTLILAVSFVILLKATRVTHHTQTYILLALLGGSLAGVLAVLFLYFRLRYACGFSVMIVGLLALMTGGLYLLA